MNRRDDCIAVIPARGGSVGIPRKNVKLLAGKPLLAWTIEAALAAPSIGRVLVSTDDGEIADVARRAGAEVVMRPPEIAGPTAASEQALLHVLDTLEAEGRPARLLAFLQCTSPLTTPEDIEGTLALVRDGGYAAAVTAADFHGFVWRQDAGGAWTGVNHDPAHRPMRQQRERQMLEVGAVYAMECAAFRRARYRFCGRVGLYRIPVWRAFEIDEPQDWALAEALMTAFQPGGAPAALPWQDMRAVVTDFDGVLTDNRVYLNSAGVETVACHRGDGWGIGLLKKAGLAVACLSTETDPVVLRRCEKLQIPCQHGLADKGAALDALCRELRVTPDQVVYIGNDTNDAPCLARAGIAVVPADAAADVVGLADLRTRARGGEGVLREVAALMLTQRAAAAPERRS
jgi:YrbI family 3-deoxy-D-manno-octulosonate 8-phosphate phosphatase